MSPFRLSVPGTDHLRRCCRDSVAWDSPPEPITDGVKVDCRWCDEIMIFKSGQWDIRHTRLLREAEPDVTAARHAEADARTGGRFSERMAADRAAREKDMPPAEPFVAPRAMPCQTCGITATYCDTSNNGITTYMCLPARHVSFVDHSRPLRLR